MKAQIQITGQIMGNFTLLRKLNSGDYTKNRFNSFTINFNTIGEAKKAMREAYKDLKKECKEQNIPLPSIAKDASFLNYDASQANILVDRE